MGADAGPRRGLDQDGDLRLTRPIRSAPQTNREGLQRRR